MFGLIGDPSGKQCGISGCLAGCWLRKVPAVAVGMEYISGGDESAGENVRRYIGPVGDGEANTRNGSLEGQHASVKDHAVSGLGNLGGSGEL